MHCVLTYLFYPLSNPDSPGCNGSAKLWAFFIFCNSFSTFYYFRTISIYK